MVCLRDQHLYEYVARKRQDPSSEQILFIPLVLQSMSGGIDAVI